MDVRGKVAAPTQKTRLVAGTKRWRSESAAKPMVDEATQARQEVMTWKEIAVVRLGQLEDRLLARKGAGKKEGDDLGAKGDADGAQGDDVDIGQKGVSEDDKKAASANT